jgi:hypothetical protein
MKWWRSRSANLALLASLILASPVAQAQSRNPVRIVVEAPYLGASMLANRLRGNLPRAITAEIASTGSAIIPPGGRLVIRISEVYLASAEPSEDFGGLSMGDAIDGEVLIYDAQGRLVARRAAAARSPVSAGGFGPILVAEARRVDALIETLAYWIARGR